MKSSRIMVSAVATLTFIFGALATGLLASTPASATGPVTTYVATTGSNTSNSCTSAATPCQTISYALTKTPAGGTVSVAAGTYAEQVTITKNVSIIGAGAASTIIEPATLSLYDSDTDSAQAQYYVVDVEPGVTSATLQSLGVNGSAGSSFFTDCSSDYVGVYYHDASGSLENVNVTGVELPEPLFGCQGGLGVYVATDGGSLTPSMVVMQNVDVSSYDKNGITCDDAGTVCTISNSVITGIGATPLIGQNGIQVFGASAQITGNTVTANNYTVPTGGTIYSADGILVINAGNLSIVGNHVSANNDNIDVLESAGEALNGSVIVPQWDPTPGPWMIDNNTVTNAQLGSVAFGDELGDGIEVDSVTSNVTVSGNTVTGNQEYGIALYGAKGVNVSLNALQENGYGVFVGGPGTQNYFNASVALNSTNNSFSANLSQASQVGIYVVAGSASNNFLLNAATKNTTTDVVDGSTGSGTKGTGDSWLLTACSTSSPTGLCPFPGHLPVIHLPVHLPPFTWPFGRGHWH